MPSEGLKQVVQMLRSQPIAEGHQSVEEIRAGFEQTGAAFPAPPDVAIEKVSANGVPAEWLTPPSAGEGVLLYLHGGGYVIGSINTHRGLVATIAKAASVRALIIDYRLAPEHPFPAAVDDATAAYRFVLASGISPSRIVIGGDSAGGGLTIATLVNLREKGERLPAAAVCLSPWVDLEGIGESMTTKAAEDPIVQKDRLVQMAQRYLGGADARHPLAAPLYADLRGLPPLLIQVGTAETLLDDARRITERARAAGVDVTLEEWEDMIHVWQIFAPMVPEGMQAINRIAEFVRQRIATVAAG